MVFVVEGIHEGMRRALDGGSAELSERDYVEISRKPRLDRTYEVGWSTNATSSPKLPFRATQIPYIPSPPRTYYLGAGAP